MAGIEFTVEQKMIGIQAINNMTNNKHNIFNKLTRNFQKQKIFIITLTTFLFIVTIGSIFLLNQFRDTPLETISPLKLSPKGWVEEDGKKYYYDPSTGTKVKGWFSYEGERYYLDTVTGEMITGKLILSPKEKFLFSPEGKLYINTTIDNDVINQYGFIESSSSDSPILEKLKNDSGIFHEELTASVQSISKAYGADGVSVALIENGEVIDSFQSGYSVVSEKIPMAENTKIRIASISKVISSMIGFKMQDDGILDLKESIGTYWGFPTINPSYPEETISLASIYTHTSSIADLNSYNKIEENLKNNTLYNNAKPGNPASSSYCNYAFAVGAATLEKAGGKILDQLADEYFFDPLNIDASFTSGRLMDLSLLAELRYDGGGLAHSIEAFQNITGTEIPGENGRYAVGGLCISAVDLAKMICILANDGIYQGNQYLSSASVSLMETPYATSDYHGVKTVQCMPLRYSEDIYGEKSLYFHSGSAYGVYSLFTYNPETKNGVVVITTGASGTTDQHGIYAVCGNISSMLYEHLRTKSSKLANYTPDFIPMEK